MPLAPEYVPAAHSVGATAPSSGGKGKPGRPPKVKAAWRPGDPKRDWDLTDYHWYCVECSKERGEKDPNEAAVAANAFN